MCSLQRNYDVIRNWERFETGPLTVFRTKATFPKTTLFYKSALIRIRWLRINPADKDFSPT